MKSHLSILFVLILSLDACAQSPYVSTTVTPTQTAIATTLSIQPVATTSFVPASTMTLEEQSVMEEIKARNPQSEASSSDQCPTILQTQSWCSIVRSAKRVTRSEWEELFPQAKFFVVEYVLIAHETGQVRRLLIAKQNGQSYDAVSFDQLLKANSIAITDDNRELVARTLVLMKLTDYLEGDVVFSDWGTTDQPAPFDMRYNYTLTAWTKIQGLKFEWVFFFYEGVLITARGGIHEQHVGDYTDVPFDVLPLPSSSEALEYWGKW